MTRSSIFSPPSCTRLVSIVAHVDHGKTSLADSLVEYNGIISERLAGTMRFLDSLEEEQRRGITIKSSAIALKHSFVPPPSSGNGDKAAEMEMVIHILDSPGHVDFAAEVSSALQICDGALLLVDVIEGMCARTHSILREAYSMNLIPILVLNKIDRLCTDLKLSPNEAYVRIRHVIESVNAAASNIIRNALADSLEHNSSFMQEHSRSSSHHDKEQIWTFEPSKGNVVFASALFGWGFSVPSLARALFKTKIIPHIKPPVMKQYLFGDYKYCSETGKVTKWKYQPSATLLAAKSTDISDTLTMFAEFALKPIWSIYAGVYTAAISVGILTSDDFQHSTQPSSTSTNDSVKIQSSSPGMNLVLDSLLVGSTAPIHLAPLIPQSAEQMQLLLNKIGASSEVNVVRGILRRYRPLSNAILDAICEHCPSPAEASSHSRTDSLSLIIPDMNEKNEKNENNFSVTSAETINEFKAIQEAVRSCQVTRATDDTVPTVAHVCKFVATDVTNINDADLRASLIDCRKADGSGALNRSVMLGIARVLSGTLCSLHKEYYAFGPKHKFTMTDQRSTIRLYLIMGSSFLRVQEVPAGHICAIYGLDDFQMKSLTLSDNKCCMPLVPFRHWLRPLVKVNVEAISISDMDVLEKGLKKLSLADASVEASVSTKGEHILACLGEIHLEQSLLDLRKLYCEREIELRISDPIVEFCECTEWFDNEVGDHEQFYDDNTPPLRQVTIPPYCYEDGLSNAKRGRCRAMLSGRGAAIHIRVVPLKDSVYSCLRTKLLQEENMDNFSKICTALKLDPSQKKSPEDLLENLNSRITCMDDQYGNILMEGTGMINGTCIRGLESDHGDVGLPSSDVEVTDDNTEIETNDSIRSSIGKLRIIRQCIRSAGILETTEITSADIFAKNIWTSNMRGSTIAGFRSACRAGPLCEEPIRGMLVIIEGVEIAVNNVGSAYEASKMISGGMVVTAMRTGIRSAFLTRPVRLSEQHFRLTLHSSLSGLGPLYAILSKRRGKVISDTMVDGTDLISIVATIPQAGSFRLAPELQEKSSGDVTAPELVFSHWEVIDEDPFWIPTSLEEREDYGEIIANGDRSTGMSSIALNYIRSVRQRKGLIVDSSKIVVAAEKQRTLARKK